MIIKNIVRIVRPVMSGLIIGMGVMFFAGQVVCAEELPGGSDITGSTGTGVESAGEPTSEPTPSYTPTELPGVPTTAPSAEPSSVPSPAVTPSIAPSAVPSPVPSPAPTGTPDSYVRLNSSSLKLNKGEIVPLILEGTGSQVTWTSSDSSVATVTKTGKVKGITAGKAIITATCNGVSYNCNITVKNKGIDNTIYTLEEGEVLRLHIDGDADVRWSSSNKKIARVKAGKVTAIKTGAVTIKAVTEERTYSCAIKIKKKTRGVIYLTFDDGPTLTSTPKILDILKKNDVKATFFVIGMDSSKKELIRREVKEGHSIAIHGASHDYGKIYSSVDAYMNNIISEQKELKKIIGYNTWITRFPGGSSNLVSRHYKKGIMTKLVKKVDKAGYAYFDWNVSSGDAGGAFNSSQVYNNVIKGLSKKRDNVVLMHDFANNTKTIEALDRIIKYGKSHGYEFRAIHAGTAEVHHGVQN